MPQNPHQAGQRATIVLRAARGRGNARIAIKTVKVDREARLPCPRAVIRYDARGFGRSPAPTVKFSLYDDLVAVLGHYGLDRVAVAGCSQGGATGLALAVEQPGRVAALVLLCTGVPGYPWADEPELDESELAAEHDRAFAAGDMDGLVAVSAKVWAAGGLTPAVLDQLRSAARAELARGRPGTARPAQLITRTLARAGRW